MKRLVSQRGEAEAKQRLLPQLFAPLEFVAVMEPRGAVAALAYGRMDGTLHALLRQ